MSQVELLADVQSVIGESPVWLDASETVYWVDAESHDVYWHSERDGAFGRRALSVPVTGLIPRSGGGWILVTKDGLYSASSDFMTVAFIVDPSAHDQRTRLNDGVADRWGRVWTGSQSREAPEDPIGRLYVVGRGSDVVEVDHLFAVTNGIAMSPDGSRAYVSDMFHSCIRVYGLDPGSGEIVDKLPAIQTQGPGYPDGLAVDRDGLIWAAYWDGGRVERMDASGAVVATIAVPADLATRACLGGRTGSRLFVASARYELDATQLKRQPLAGALFTTDVDAVGIPPAEAHL
jgi:sugar lactone lactonase YvrE